MFSNYTTNTISPSIHAPDLVLEFLRKDLIGHIHFSAPKLQTRILIELNDGDGPSESVIYSDDT